MIMLTVKASKSVTKSWDNFGFGYTSRLLHYFSFCFSGSYALAIEAISQLTWVISL